MRTLKKYTFLILCAVFVFTACLKKQTYIPAAPVDIEERAGLPDNPHKINGYLYYSFNVKGFYTSTRHYYAVFHDPGSSLMKSYNHRDDIVVNDKFNLGNVAVGGVRFNDNIIVPPYPLQISYYASSAAYYPYNPVVIWKVSGKESFHDFRKERMRDLPYINKYVNITEVSLSQGLVVNTDTLFSGFDSLIIKITDKAHSLSYVKKHFAPGIKEINFSSEELKSLKAGPGAMYFHAFNYTHFTINNKVYVTEACSKLEKTISLTE